MVSLQMCIHICLGVVCTFRCVSIHVYCVCTICICMVHCIPVIVCAMGNEVSPPESHLSTSENGRGSRDRGKLGNGGNLI